MNSKELAEKLNGCDYGNEVSKEIAQIAKDHGLVIVFGASDDLMEFRGAINDELSAYEGTTAYLNSNGLLQNDCENEECPHFAKMKESATTIEALWASEEIYCWTFSTVIPHETFEVMEDKGQYCRGIVFALKDI